MGASQGKKKDAKKDSQVGIDPGSSAALGKQLAQNRNRGGQVMPWNEDNDSDMNDREGAGPARVTQPQDAGAQGRVPPQQTADDSFEELQRQIEQIERQNQLDEQNEQARRQNVSLDSAERNGGASEGAGNDDEMFEAIVASLIDYTKANKNGEQEKEARQEDRQLKEVLTLSKLENEAKTGKLNLDFLKKKNKGANSPRQHETPIPAQYSSIIPQPSTQATFIIPGPSGGQGKSNLPPPAMVTAVVNMKPIPEISINQAKIVPQPSLPSLSSKPKVAPLEEHKISPRLIAPKNLAPITSKTKATLPPLTMPQKTSKSVAGVNPFESKLSQIPNNQSDNETEFESHKTHLPREHHKLDEIQALMGHERSMAELQTSINTRSPGPTARSKMNMAMEASSMHPAESSYNVNQQSMRDDQNSILGGLLSNMSPNATGKVIGGQKHSTPYDKRVNMTLNAKKQQKENVMDEYEDLLNTIEQETQQNDFMSSAAKSVARNSQISLTQGGRTGSYQPNKMATNSSEMAGDQVSNLRSMMVRRNDEPTIDFQLEQEMLDLTIDAQKKKQSIAMEEVAALDSRHAKGTKKNLNESSGDFDLDNI